MEEGFFLVHFHQICESTWRKCTRNDLGNRIIRVSVCWIKCSSSGVCFFSLWGPALPESGPASGGAGQASWGALALGSGLPWASLSSLCSLSCWALVFLNYLTVWLLHALALGTKGGLSEFQSECGFVSHCAGHTLNWSCLAISLFVISVVRSRSFGGN